MKKAVRKFWLYHLPEILLIVGGLNWGLVGLFNFDLVAFLLGSGSFMANLVYVLVGISALMIAGYKLLVEKK